MTGSGRGPDLLRACPGGDTVRDPPTCGVPVFWAMSSIASPSSLISRPVLGCWDVGATRGTLVEGVVPVEAEGVGRGRLGLTGSI